jgi:hypothetical protein
MVSLSTMGSGFGAGATMPVETKAATVAKGANRKINREFFAAWRFGKKELNRISREHLLIN